MDQVLYIDDNQTNLIFFKELLKEHYKVFITSSKDVAIQKLESEEYKVVFVDYLMPEVSGLDFISLAKKTSPDSLYIILTAYANLEVAISALNQGNIFRFIEKPFKEPEITNAIKNAFEIYNLRIHNRNLMENIKLKNKELTKLKEQLEDENLYLQEEIISNTGFEEIISKDPAFKPVLKKVEQVSGTQATALILGETGTGKELIAEQFIN